MNEENQTYVDNIQTTMGPGQRRILTKNMNAFVQESSRTSAFKQSQTGYGNVQMFQQNNQRTNYNASDSSDDDINPLIKSQYHSGRSTKSQTDVHEYQQDQKLYQRQQKHTTLEDCKQEMQNQQKIPSPVISDHQRLRDLKQQYVNDKNQQNENVLEYAKHVAYGLHIWIVHTVIIYFGIYICASTITLGMITSGNSECRKLNIFQRQCYIYDEGYLSRFIPSFYIGKFLTKDLQPLDKTLTNLAKETDYFIICYLIVFTMYQVKQVQIFLTRLVLFIWNCAFSLYFKIIYMTPTLIVTGIFFINFAIIVTIFDVLQHLFGNQSQTTRIQKVVEGYIQRINFYNGQTLLTFFQKLVKKKQTINEQAQNLADINRQFEQEQVNNNNNNMNKNQVNQQEMHHNLNRNNDVDNANNANNANNISNNNISHNNLPNNNIPNNNIPNNNIPNNMNLNDINNDNNQHEQYQSDINNDDNIAD